MIPSVNGGRKIRCLIKNEELVQERRGRILSVAAKLFLKKGFDKTSMSEIAQAVGMSRDGLYHYVGNKHDIAYLIQDFMIWQNYHLREQITDKIKGLNPREALRICIELHIRGVDETQDMENFANHVIASFPQNYRQTIFGTYAEFVNYYDKLLQKGVAAGEFRIENTQLAAQNIVLIAYAWAHRRWILRKQFTLDDYIKLQANMILNSITPTATGTNIFAEATASRK